jgi:hypothetical protein
MTASNGLACKEFAVSRITDYLEGKYASELQRWLPIYRRAPVAGHLIIRQTIRTAGKLSEQNLS